MNILQQLSTTSVWKPFSMQWPFCRIGGGEGSAFLFQSQCSGHMPWALNDKMKEKGTVQQLAEVGGVFFYVKVKKSNLYQSMLFVDDSLIAGAGQGLFLRPDQHGTFYRKNTVMCFYSMLTFSNEQVLELPSSNYLMKVRKGYIDARKFESFNLGRLSNQGGLLQALKRLVRDLQNCGTTIMTRF